MLIIGNGVDIVNNFRIKKAIKNKAFIKRIYSRGEIIDSKKTKNKICFDLFCFSIFFFNNY